jgi:hypothetical protein
MNAWTPPPAEPVSDRAVARGDEAAVVERQLELLGRLAEIGLGIAEAVGRQAAQDGPSRNSPAFTGDLALAYARASRAVRMSIALQSRLMAERREAAITTAANARMSAVRDRPARRARIDRIVERLARDAYEDDEEEVERCVAEAAERLNDVDVFGDVLDRPVSEIIALICHELDISPDWAALAEEAWARQEMAGGDVGAPLAALRPRSPTPTVIPETAQRLSGTQPLRAQRCKRRRLPKRNHQDHQAHQEERRPPGDLRVLRVLGVRSSFFLADGFKRGAAGSRICAIFDRSVRDDGI